VLTRVFACGLALILAAPAWAQQQTPAVAADINLQVRLFEGVLSGSVISGGKAAAEQAQKYVPSLSSLALSAEPKVRGWWSPSIGYQYYVELPLLLGTQVVTFTQQMQMRQGQGTPVNRTGGGTAGQGASAQNTVGATNAMDTNLVGSFDIAAAYRDAVYAQLLNVILENSGGLPIKDDEVLQVVSAPAPLAPSFMFPDDRKLILQIRGADLKAYHEHKITKEEARQKIVETRF